MVDGLRCFELEMSLQDVMGKKTPCGLAVAGTGPEPGTWLEGLVRAVLREKQGVMEKAVTLPVGIKDP